MLQWRQTEDRAASIEVVQQRRGADVHGFPERGAVGRQSLNIPVRSTGGGVAEQVERGLFVRSVAPVAEWLRWDGRGGNWGGWRWGSPQRDRATRRANEGYAHRTVPAGWCRHASAMAQMAPPVAGREGAREEAAPAARSGGVDGVRPGGTFLGQVALHLEDVRGEPEGAVGSACFGQVSRRLGRFLKRLPKSRSWSDGLRVLRRSSSNGSLLTTSGTGEEENSLLCSWKLCLKGGESVEPGRPRRLPAHIFEHCLNCTDLPALAGFVCIPSPTHIG